LFKPPFDAARKAASTHNGSAALGFESDDGELFKPPFEAARKAASTHNGSAALAFAANTSGAIGRIILFYLPAHVSHSTR
jgi:hypothetical protein